MRKRAKLRKPRRSLRKKSSRFSERLTRKTTRESVWNTVSTILGKDKRIKLPIDLRMPRPVVPKLFKYVAYLLLTYGTYSVQNSSVAHWKCLRDLLLGHGPLFRNHWPRPYKQDNRIKNSIIDNTANYFQTYSTWVASCKTGGATRTWVWGVQSS